MRKCHIPLVHGQTKGVVRASVVEAADDVRLLGSISSVSVSVVISVSEVIVIVEASVAGASVVGIGDGVRSLGTISSVTVVSSGFALVIKSFSVVVGGMIVVLAYGNEKAIRKR